MLAPGFAAELRRAAEPSGVVPRRVAESPPEWRLGRLTVVIDPRRQAAQLRYARNPVARARCEPGEVMAAWERALARLGKESLEPERFAPALVAAYEALRAGGERVELAQLAAEIARATGRRRYARAQLAWDLARLKTERGLTLPQGRIVLDVATGRASARHMLWIEDDSGTGQYYRSFRLIRP